MPAALDFWRLVENSHSVQSFSLNQLESHPEHVEEKLVGILQREGSLK
jgi:hypothetical protein